MESSSSNETSIKGVFASLSPGHGQSRFEKPLPPIPTPFPDESPQPSQPTRPPPSIPTSPSPAGHHENECRGGSSSSSKKTSREQDQQSSQSTSFTGPHLNRVASIQKSRHLRKKISDRLLRIVRHQDDAQFPPSPLPGQPGTLRRVKGGILDRIRDFSDGTRSPLPDSPLTLTAARLITRRAEDRLRSAIEMRGDYQKSRLAPSNTSPFRSENAAHNNPSPSPHEPMASSDLRGGRASGGGEMICQSKGSDEAIKNNSAPSSNEAMASSDSGDGLVSGGDILIPHLRGIDSDVRYAYAAMRGQDHYNNRGVLYDSIPFAENKPKEDEDDIRPRDGDSDSGTNFFENRAFVGDVPSEPVVRADRQPRTQESLNNMAGYVSINGQIVDPDGLSDICRALKDAPMENRVSSDADPRSLSNGYGSAQLPIFAQRLHFDLHKDDRKSGGLYVDNDSDTSHHSPLVMTGAMFKDISQNIQPVRSRSKTCTEQRAAASALELSRQAPKPPSSRQDLGDIHRARRDFNSSGELSNYSVEKFPSPKPEGEGQDLRYIPKMYARMNGMPTPAPEHYLSAHKARSLKRDKFDPERGRLDLRKAYSESPGRHKSAPPRLPRSGSRVRIAMQGGGIYEPGVEQPTTLASAHLKLTQPEQPNLGVKESIHDDELDAAKLYTINKALLDSDWTVIERRRLLADNKIEALQPYARLNLTGAEMVANRKEQIPLRDFRVELINGQNRWLEESVRIKDQWDGTDRATALYLRHIKDMRSNIMDTLREANRRIAEADSQYYELKDEYIEAEARVAEQEEKERLEKICSVQSEQMKCAYDINSGVSQQPQFHATPPSNSHGDFNALQAVAQQHKNLPVQPARDPYAQESLGFHGFEAHAPRGARLQPLPQAFSQQQPYVSGLEHNALHKQYNQQLQSAPNPQEEAQQRRGTSGQFQQTFDFETRTGPVHFVVNSAGVSSAPLRMPHQQQNSFGGAQYNEGQQTLNAPVQFAGNTPGEEVHTQAFAPHHPYGALPRVEQRLGYHGQNRLPYGDMNTGEISAQTNAPQLQHNVVGGFQQDIVHQPRDVQLSSGVNTSGDSDAQTNKGLSYHEDSDLSECEVCRDQQTGEFIVNPRRASRMQPGIALHERNTLGRIDEESVSQPSTVARASTTHQPQPIPSSPSVGRQRYTRALTPRARGPRGTAIIRKNSTPGSNGLRPLRLATELSSPHWRPSDSPKNFPPGSGGRQVIADSSSPFQGGAHQVTPQPNRGADPQPAQTPRYAWQQPYTLVRPRPVQARPSGMTPPRNEEYTQPSRPQNMGMGMSAGNNYNQAYVSSVQDKDCDPYGSRPFHQLPSRPRTPTRKKEKEEVEWDPDFDVYNESPRRFEDTPYRQAGMMPPSESDDERAREDERRFGGPSGRGESDW